MKLYTGIVGRDNKYAMALKEIQSNEESVSEEGPVYMLLAIKT